MSKAILIFVIIMLTGIINPSFSKGIYVNDSVGTEGSASEFDLEVYNYFVNQYDDTVLFVWERVNVNVPDNWETSVCIGDICYEPEVSTEKFILFPGDTMLVIGHFYPNNHKGSGFHNVIIYPDSVDGINEAVEAKYYVIATESTMNVKELKKNPLKITRLYPNPVANNLSVQLLNNSNYQIVIYNVLGEKVLERRISNNNATNISVEHLNSGMYMISVTDLISGNKVTRTISKY